MTRRVMRRCRAKRYLSRWTTICVFSASIVGADCASAQVEPATCSAGPGFCVPRSTFVELDACDAERPALLREIDARKAETRHLLHAVALTSSAAAGARLRASRFWGYYVAERDARLASPPVSSSWWVVLGVVGGVALAVAAAHLAPGAAR